MATPRIGYLSMLRDAVTITDPGSASGFPITNLYDLKATTKWRSNTVASPITIDIDSGSPAKSANYLGLVNTNLATLGADVKVYTGPTYPPGNVRLASTVPSTDGVVYLPFSGPSSRYWSIVIGEALGGAPFASAPEIGEAFFGTVTNSADRLAPGDDPYFTFEEPIGASSSGGHYLKRTTRRIHRGTLSFGAAGADRDDWTDFLHDHALKRYPFFFVLSLLDSEYDTAFFVRATDDAEAGRLAVGGRWSRLRVDLDFEEAYSEAA